MLVGNSANRAAATQLRQMCFRCESNRAQNPFGGAPCSVSDTAAFPKSPCGGGWHVSLHFSSYSEGDLGGVASNNVGFFKKATGAHYAHTPIDSLDIGALLGRESPVMMATWSSAHAAKTALLTMSWALDELLGPASAG